MATFCTGLTSRPHVVTSFVLIIGIRFLIKSVIYTISNYYIFFCNYVNLIPSWARDNRVGRLVTMRARGVQVGGVKRRATVERRVFADVWM